MCTQFFATIRPSFRFSTRECTWSAHGLVTFTKLKSGSGRAQIRRKGPYINETFLRRRMPRNGRSIWSEFYNPTRKRARNGMRRPSSSNGSTKRKPRAPRIRGAVQPAGLGIAGTDSLCALALRRRSIGTSWRTACARWRFRLSSHQEQFESEPEAVSSRSTISTVPASRTPWVAGNALILRALLLLSRP